MTLKYILISSEKSGVLEINESAKFSKEIDQPIWLTVKQKLWKTWGEKMK